MKMKQNYITKMKLIQLQDFAVLGRLSEEEFMVEVQMVMTKLRWEKKKFLEEESDEQVVVTEKETEIIEEEEANIANMKVDPLEVITTEDMLSRVNDHNQKVTEVDPDIKTVLVGCDAISLFPSMKSMETGRAVRQATINIVKESGLKFEGLDIQEIAKYVKMNMSDKMRNIMDQAKMTRYMEGSYVDDIRYVVSRLTPGMRWGSEERKFLFKKEE